MQESKFQILKAAILRVSINVRFERMERRNEPARIETARFFIKRSAIRIAPRETKIAAMTGMFHSIEQVYHAINRKKRDFL